MKRRHRVLREAIWLGVLIGSTIGGFIPDLPSASVDCERVQHRLCWRLIPVGLEVRHAGPHPLPHFEVWSANSSPLPIMLAACAALLS